jgi:hypothetical protein
MTEYSEELINRIIKYYGEKHNHFINRETAIEYLDSLGTMFAVFAESKGEKKESHQSQ